VLENGVMELLLVVSEKYRHDSDIMGLVAKIFSSMAVHPDAAKNFEESGKSY
jgi:hypothetical protein